MTGHIGARATVLGAGMAGLLAARVLADDYAEVVVIERDPLTEGVADRPGTAQGRHAHALLAGGQQALEQLFPGFTDQLAGRGIPTGDVLEHTRMYLSGHRLRPGPSDLTVISASRAVLEQHVRARTLALPNVHIVDQCDATGVVLDEARRRAVGVQLLRRDDSSAAETIDTDVAIDTTGRGSRAPAWLETIGMAAPPEEHLRIDVAYATRRYRMSSDTLDGDVAVIVGPTPAHRRGGVLALLGGGQAMLTLTGMHGDRPPLDPAAFEEFARSLAFPDIHDAVATAQPIDDPVPHRFPTSRWRRYDRLDRVPDGFAAMGDSVCSLNPVYGQGMTVAALEALALRRHLSAHRGIRSRRFQRELAKIVRAPWQMTAGADLQFPETQGRRTRSMHVLAGYVARLHARASSDARLARAFVRVAGLVDPPHTLLRPTTALRVLRS